MNEEQNLRYSIQLIDSEADVTRTVRLSLRGLRMIAFGAGAAVAVLPGAAVLSVYTLMHSYLHESETAQLREANRIQQEQILQVSKKASALQQDLDSLRRSEDGLRALVGAPPAEADEEDAAKEGTEAPTGGAPHALTTDEVDEALAMIESRLTTRRSSLDLLAQEMYRNFPGAGSFLRECARHYSDGLAHTGVYQLALWTAV